MLTVAVLFNVGKNCQRVYRHVVGVSMHDIRYAWHEGVTGGGEILPCLGGIEVNSVIKKGTLFCSMRQTSASTAKPTESHLTGNNRRVKKRCAVRKARYPINRLAPINTGTDNTRATGTPSIASFKPLTVAAAMPKV